MNELNNRKKVAFVLGREKDLAVSELKAVLVRFCFSFCIYKISGNVAFANIENFSEQDALRLVDTAAGIIKIFFIDEKIYKPTSHDLANLIVRVRGIENKIDFGISSFISQDQAKKVNAIGYDVKSNLVRTKARARFIELRDGTELSSIVSLKNKLVGKGVEIGLFGEGVGILVALNNPEEWSNRDYGKPASDKFSGMLPPKLARMMVNLSLAEIAPDHVKNKTLIVDPFCGSGNVLMEALLLGQDVFGSDVSEKAVSDSKKNVSWLIDKYELEGAEFKIEFADATKAGLLDLLNTKYKTQAINRNLIVVAEPFLGEPKRFSSDYNTTVRQYEEVKELYLKFFENFSKLTTGTKRLVFCLVFPLVETKEKKSYSLFSNIVDEIKNLGYTQIRDSFVYGRDYQVVKREIVLLHRNTK